MTAAIRSEPAAAPSSRRVAAGGQVVPFEARDVESSVPEVFARRTRAHASRLALAFGARAFRYAELDAEAERVARRLLAGAATREPGRVVLLLEDRLRQVVGLLGVLKAGHAFVPLDPDQPAPRLAACIRDAEPCALLCERSTLERGRALARELADAPRVVDLQSEADAAPALPRTAAPGDVAYLLYTSGSTGEPKAVVQTHRNVLHNAAKLTVTQALRCDDRMTMLGNAFYAFAMSDIFGALLNGAALLPYDVRRQGIDGLAGFVIAEEITIWSSVPTLFRHATAQLTGERFPSVRLLKLAGEPVQRRDFETFRRRFPRGARFLNSLGATEFNTIRQNFLDHDTPQPDELVPVGHAVPATDVLILDAEGRPLGPGCEGEIAVRSPFLSPGYWRRPEQTQRAFIADPEGSATRVYRTGDLGMLREDGCLLHFGRLDGQVRIRGHRVETAEVEAALLAIPKIRAAAVVAQPSEGGDLELVAWLTSRAKRGPSPESLRAALARSLPDFMLPARFVYRGSLPLLASGKVDRRALAGPAPPAAGAPRAELADPLERRIAALWCAGLRLRAIDRDADFFELGGHSLVAARIVTRIQHELGVVVPLTLFRDAPTVARMAERLRRGEIGAGGVVVALQAGEAPLPLVVVPGAGTDAFAVQELARALGPDQAVLALQMPGLRPGEVPPASVEALAALYVRELRAQRPEGPYALVGESFGGVVAFEMAQQLWAAGQHVALLAVLDTYAPGHPRLRRRGPATWPRRFVRWLRPRGRKEVAALWNLRRGVRERWIGLRFRAYRRRHGVDAVVPTRWRYDYLRQLCFHAQERYRPEPYPGAMLLLRAEQRAPADLYTSDDDLGWRPLAKGDFEVRDVPGVHGDAMTQPHVALTARILCESLRAAGSR